MSILGLSVEITNPQRMGGRREGRVRSVGGPAASITFTDLTNQTMSVADYFASRYSELQYPLMPVLDIGSKKKPDYQPIEVCDFILTVTSIITIRIF